MRLKTYVGEVALDDLPDDSVVLLLQLHFHLTLHVFHVKLKFLKLVAVSVNVWNSSTLQGCRKQF